MQHSALLGLGVVFAAVGWRSWSWRKQNLRDIPTIGLTGVLSYWSAIKNVLYAHKAVQRGYNEHHGSLFKIPLMSKWMVVAASSELVDDIRKAHNDELSLTESIAENFQMALTIGPEIPADPWHSVVVKTFLARNLAKLVPDLRDEVHHAISARLPGEKNGEVCVLALSAMSEIVVQSLSRIFVGPLLCRDKEYQQLVVQFSTEVATRAALINLFPKCLQSFIGRMVTTAPRRIAQATEFLEPIISEHVSARGIAEASSSESSNDLIAALLDDGKAAARSTRDLVLRVMASNIAATHTTAMSLTYALYELAVGDGTLVDVLREEIIEAVRDAGWTKRSLDNMHKMDSFLKESQRLHGLGCLMMGRKTLKPFAFSNGVVLPKGTYLAAPSYAIHHDPENYENPELFDGLRFAGAHESIKYQLTTPSLDFLAFGNGRHACPGRFLASCEMKLILAAIVMDYDVGLPVPGSTYPPDEWFGPTCMPNRQAQVVFRRRGDSAAS